MEPGGETSCSTPDVRLTWANRTLGNLPETPEGPRLTLTQALSKLGAFDYVVSVLGAAEPQRDQAPVRQVGVHLDLTGGFSQVG